MNDLLNAKDLFFDGKNHNKAFLDEKLVWSKNRGEINKDFKDIFDNEEWQGSLIYDNIPNILELGSHSTWSKSNISKNGDIYTVSRELSHSGGWGIISEQTMTLIGGQEYTLYAEISTKDTPQLSYNFIISADGNQGVSRIDLIQDGRFHSYVITLTPNKNRRSAGILFGADSRRNAGIEYQIRNMALFKGNYPHVLGGGVILKGFRI